MSTTTRTQDLLDQRWEVTLDDFITVTDIIGSGDRVLAGSLSGRAEILEAKTGETIAPLDGHAMGVLSGAWSPDGTSVATAGHDARLRLYRAADLAPTASVALDGWGTTLAWSPDAALVAVGAGRTVTVVEPDGTEVARWSDLPSTITAVAWSIDGMSVGAACYGGLRWMRPSQPDRPPKHLAWKGSLLSIDVAPDGRWVAAGCQDASTHIWRLWSGEDLQMAGYPAKIEHLAWDPSSRYLAIGSVGDVTIWDFSGKGPQGSTPTTLDGHTRHVSALAYNHDGSRLVSGDADGNLFVWAPPKRTSPTGQIHLDSGVAAVSWSADGSSLIVGTEHGSVLALGITRT